MEADSEGEKARALAAAQEGEIRTKRKMKTRSQLEVLERAYAAAQYPSEAVRAELSKKLDLSDRQLQMWFCHRRLKDRRPAAVSGKRQRKESVAGETRVVSEGGAEQLLIEARAVAFVEAQLGEPFREDGPMLGLEFDPLPPDAFGSSAGLATVGQQKHSGWPSDANVFEQSTKPIKGASRTFREYQFLPEKPTVRTDTYERATLSHHYDSPTESPHARIPLSTVSSFIYGNEQVPSVYGFQSQLAGLNLLTQQGRAGHLLPSASEEYSKVHGKNFTNITMEAHFSAHLISQLNNPFIPFSRRVTDDEDDVLQLGRKHKSEEARIMREVEAHERRIRKELEKQDILRQKREEHIRKEMERVDRERRKEEERLLREKQREEERYLREQRRELERKEKLLQKESMRAEKMRQKEELRREKEAARLKAANERAISRKNAKESIELIDDEALELMELAASSKGLPSMLSLDYETLQNLESFRDLRSTFPPKSVQLKKPFGIQPWIDSEENIGNLLMAWRFLITFLDVLGLWPFTLDEFVQAFHDYDSRLLGEIHISLLRFIIKDIEDVARTSSVGVGANPNCAANPGGGHPQIVEGAYAWGFDIKSWKCNLNPLTWPEILRQFSVSAGFGPQLKKRAVEPAYLYEDNEGIDVKDIISNLRSGVAVRNAFAIMQERGFSNPRKSRHLLTPGTVKFAAFHVLSLEGSNGLTILEVADRIQKSGLRDLTTSKTPEASVAAALSRDSKLFERTAPSTYCVHAPYRKDITDSEAVLSAARERIQTFKSKHFDVEGADEAEKDEESESDVVVEDPEVDDRGTEVNPEIVAQNSEEGKNVSDKISLESRKGSHMVSKAPGDLTKVTEAISSISDSFIKVENTGCSLDDSVDAAGICNNAANHDQEDTEIDDSNPGEPWVQGLTEGEYSDLSVEERLNALVALIGVAMEGNSIRIVLEERLEAANALKKQMWAVAQVDKRRLKEEHVIKMQYTPSIGNETEQILAIPSLENRQSPSPTVDEKNLQTTVKLSVLQEQIVDPQNEQNNVNSFPSVGNLQMQEYSVGPDNLPFQQAGLIADRSLKQLKSYIGHKAEEMYVYRSLPLGEDRRHNRYWQFITSASRNDPGCGRIFVELHDGRWRLIDSEEGFDGLSASLDVRGYRESHLQTMLQKTETFFKEAVRKIKLDSNWGRHIKDTVKTDAEMPSGYECSGGADSPTSSVSVVDSYILESSVTFSIELGKNETEKTGALKRYQDLERWIWKESVGSVFCADKKGKKRCPQLLDICSSCHGMFYLEENHCNSCHRTFGQGEIDFPQHVVLCNEKLNWNSDSNIRGLTSSPLRVRLLKVLLALTEVSVPLEALQPCWTDMNRNCWGRKLHSSSSAEDLLQVLASLESAVKIEYLSSNFETTGELLSSSNEKSSSSSPDNVAVLPWIPLTTAAVALRLMELDAAILDMLKQKLETQKEKESGNFIKLSIRSAVMKSFQNEEISRTLHQSKDSKEGKEYLGSELTSSCHVQGRGRTRGGRVPKKAIGLKANPRRKSKVTAKDRLGQVQVLKWKGKPRGRGGRKRGNRSIRGKETCNRVIKIGGERTGPKERVYHKSPKDFVENSNVGKTASENNASGSGRSEYEMENGDASEDEFDHVHVDDYAGGFNLEGDEDAVNEESDDDEGDGAQNSKVDFDVSRYINGERDEKEHIADVSIQQRGEGTRSPSSDYRLN